MKVNSQQDALLDRGGNPTLRELLDRMAFSPANGHINLSGARMILQKASYGSRLREELIERHGRDETLILLTRLGYRAGVEDAEFVRASWPYLNLGDAFTAGTRLHAMCGMVRVETVFNDFDFKKGKFAAEFIWHDGVEGGEYCKHHGTTDQPVCWGQLGYASGYASFYLDKLVVYKEVQCVATGSPHCRIVGKTAESWGDDDEFVQLYRQEILPARRSSVKRLPIGHRLATNPTTTERTHKPSVLLAPVKAQLDEAASINLPVLITGPEGSGKRAAANFLHHTRFGRGAALHWLSAFELDAEQLGMRLTTKPKGSTKGASGQTFVLEDVERLSDQAQQVLIEVLSAPAGPLPEQTRLIATSRCTSSELAQSSTLRAGLYFRLSVLSISMPSLSGREDILKLAGEILRSVSERHNRQAPRLTDDAKTYLSNRRFPGNLPEIEALLTAALFRTSGQRSIDAATLRRSATEPASNEDLPASLKAEIDRAISRGSLSIDALNEHIYQAAVSAAGNNLSRAARLLSISRAQFSYRLSRRS
ncbi:XylR N-terminal domain-containing protein [Bradyrhizobium manausense]|uniref:XylR N-terminal domain-containing protein n=1 Tax=Bradyrhizobium manausense TaxID=989370 RepID=UPI001BAE4D14|nr:XylR N-terminal domain-containing protein [Bradyrhizobium manausense]